MNPEERSEFIEMILDVFYERKGFEDWFDNIDEESCNDIFDTLHEKIQEFFDNRELEKEE